MSVGWIVRSSDISDSEGYPRWFSEVHEEFQRKILDADGFPCHFGVNAERSDRNWFTACDETADVAAVLSDSLRLFAAQAGNGPDRQSLIAFIGPPRRTAELASEAERFWSILGEVSRHDDSEWPADRTQDVTEPRWQWCFTGRPWFVIGCSPAYQARRSRNVGPCLTMVFQLVELVFSDLSGSSAAGKAAKKQIRSRLRRYDAVGPHPHLGDPEQSSVYKWRQYLLPDDDSVYEPGACPLASLPGARPGTVPGTVPGAGAARK